MLSYKLQSLLSKDSKLGDFMRNPTLNKTQKDSKTINVLCASLDCTIRSKQLHYALC